MLTPTKKGTMGTKNLNKELQKILNPKSKLKIEKEFGEVVFREGDKVMQIKNNYDLYWETIKGNGYGTGVFNGDLGIINKIDGNIVEVIYDDEKIVKYEGNLEEGINQYVDGKSAVEQGEKNEIIVALEAFVALDKEINGGIRNIKLL